MSSSPPMSPTALVHPTPQPARSRPTSTELFDPEFSFDRVEPPKAPEHPRISPKPTRGRTFDLITQTPPVPPSLKTLITAPEGSARARTLSLIALGQSLPSMAPTNAACRAPSPLPPPLIGAIPTEIQDMGTRLTELIAQSNEYVRGLASRLEALELGRASLTGAATVENLSVFIETRPRFAGLDVDRIVTFGLPLHVWQHVGAQILREHEDDERGLGNILYWRGRAEAEAMGLLVSDHRGSKGSLDTSAYGPSPRSSASLGGEPSRQASGEIGVPPRRPSARSARSFTSIVSANSSVGSRHPSPSAGV